MGELWQKATAADRAQLAGACLIAILLLGGIEIQRHREQRPATDAQSALISLGSPEAHLATIQLGRRPGPTSSTVKRFASLLDILEADCPANTRRNLADLTVRSLRELRHGGIHATPNQILGGVLGTTDMGALSECSSYFRRFVNLRQHQGEASP